MNESAFAADNLFDLEQTRTKSFFLETVYAWEILPKIGEILTELAHALPEDFKRIGEKIWVGRGSTIEPGAAIKGPAIIGYDCEIRHGAYIRENAIVGNEVIIGGATEIKNAILFNNVMVPHFNYIGDSVLGYRSHLGAGVILSNVKLDNKPVKVREENGHCLETGLKKFGALIGDFVEIGCNAVLNPGTIVGRECIIYPLTSVSGVVPSHCIVKNDGRCIQRINVSSGSPFEESIGFSRAVRIGDFISVSGTAPIDTDGSAAYPDDVYNQTRLCIDIMKKSIEKAGGRLNDVIRTRIMMKDISRWEEAARAHGEYFSRIKPACTFVEVSGFINPDWLVELEADCVVENARLRSEEP